MRRTFFFPSEIVSELHAASAFFSEIITLSGKGFASVSLWLLFPWLCECLMAASLSLARGLFDDGFSFHEFKFDDGFSFSHSIETDKLLDSYD